MSLILSQFTNSQAGTATPAGVSSTAALGTVTAMAGVNANPAGVAVTAAVGAVTATGAAILQLALTPARVGTMRLGVSRLAYDLVAVFDALAASVGSVTARSVHLASPVGVAATTAVGSASASGSALLQLAMTPARVGTMRLGVSRLAYDQSSIHEALTATLGSVTAHAVYLASPAGVAAVAAIGSAAPAAAALLQLALTPARVGVMRLGINRLANTQTSILQALTAAVGSAIAHEAAAPVGVSMTAAIGSVTAHGAALTDANGLEALSALGTVEASGAESGTAMAEPVGVSALATVGNVVTTGDASIEAVGVAMATAVGQATDGSAPPVEPPVEEPMWGGALAPRRRVSVSATAFPNGVSARAALGIVTATGAANVTSDGVQASIAVGQVLASADAFVPMSGVKSQAYRGRPTVDLRPDPIDRAWADLQREEDDLMVMLLDTV